VPGAKQPPFPPPPESLLSLLSLLLFLLFPPLSVPLSSFPFSIASRISSNISVVSLLFGSFVPSQPVPVVCYCCFWLSPGIAIGLPSSS